MTGVNKNVAGKEKRSRKAIPRYFGNNNLFRQWASAEVKQGYPHFVFKS
jgi:hypothetical protein